GGDVVATGGADGHRIAGIQQNLAEIAHGRVAGTAVIGAREGVEGNQVDLAGHVAQHGREFAGVLAWSLTPLIRMYSMVARRLSGRDSRYSLTLASSSLIGYLRLSGTIWLRSSSLGACREIASEASVYWRSRRMAGTTPEVLMVTRRFDRP